ncbi:hypothetical protein BJ742DRAFT_768963 [Cladochytrium replicatum]|nr:hypothetical protein BJ742DRAFT_768963 [Cladochytrium replicatum]
MRYYSFSSFFQVCDSVISLTTDPHAAVGITGDNELKTHELSANFPVAVAAEPIKSDSIFESTTTQTVVRRTLTRRVIRRRGGQIVSEDTTTTTTTAPATQTIGDPTDYELVVETTPDGKTVVRKIRRRKVVTVTKNEIRGGVRTCIGTARASMITTAATSAIWSEDED